MTQIANLCAWQSSFLAALLRVVVKVQDAATGSRTTDTWRAVVKCVDSQHGRTG